MLHVVVLEAVTWISLQAHIYYSNLHFRCFLYCNPFKIEFILIRNKLE